MVTTYQIFVLTIISTIISITLSQAPTYRRFEYKHSFRAPNLSQRDGSIPFWMVTGDAIASSEQLRLAPSMRSRKGIAWNKRPFVESENFEIEMQFKVTGQGRIGADGLALWYTAQQGTLGEVFGSNDYWTGLGVLFDSFDNDGQKNNPYVSVMINDGTRSYDHQTDGAQQILTGCQRDFRNKPFPIHVKVEYIKNVLTVSLTDGLTQQHRFELCLRAENIFLPRNGYFGISAATGALADDHDILDFSVYSVLNEAPKPAAQAIPQDERQKYDAEFAKQMEQYEDERKKFKQEHPDKAKLDNEEEEYARHFEDAAARELRLIYETQNAIHQVMQQMEAKLAQIQQAQNVHTSMLQQRGGVPPPVQTGQQQQQQPPLTNVGGGVGDGFQQAEKNEVIQGVRDLSSSIRDMKNYVNEIFTRTYNLEQKIGGPAVTAAQEQTKQQLDNLQNDIRQIRATQIAQGSAPQLNTADCSNCLTTTLFVLIAIAQSGVILVFVFIRSKQEKAKFY
jgi:mannose-binding lectin 1